MVASVFVFLLKGLVYILDARLRLWALQTAKLRDTQAPPT